jgi:peptide/nickel transport system substrate-binding protein
VKSAPPQLLLALKALSLCLLQLFLLCACSTPYPQKSRLDKESQAADLASKPSIQKLFVTEQTTAQQLKPATAEDIASGKVAEFFENRGATGNFGGSLTVATFGSGPKTFNPWAATEVESHGIGQLLFESLIDVDPWTGEHLCRLARSFEVSADKRDYIFHLRKGLQWSDGVPLTADDVIFTFGTLIKEGFGNQSLRDTLSIDGEYPSIEKIDDYTVKFHTQKPFSPFLAGLHGLGVAPKHALKKYTKRPHDEFFAVWDVNCKPADMVTSGPFRVEHYVPSQRVELIRNPLYGMCDALHRRLPYLDRFTEAIVPDQNSMLVKFYGNELDFLDIRSIRGPDARLMKQREDSGNFKMYNLGSDDGTMFLMFNLNQRKDPKTGKYYVDPMKQKWFNNLAFRQAVSHAIDRTSILNNVLRGVGSALYTAESPTAIYLDKKLKPYNQDLEFSKKLLADAGFKFSHGWLLDPEGNKIEFTLNTNAGNSIRDGTCVIIQNDLKKLGIKVNYQPIDFNILVDKTNHSLDWEAVVMGLTGDKVEPYNGANIWKTEGRLHMFDQRLPDPTGKTSVTDERPWEKDISHCFNAAAATFDQAQRHKYFDRYQEIAYEQLPFIYLYAALDLTAMRNTHGNYNPTPLGIYYTPKGSLHNIEEIFDTRAKSQSKNH